MRAAVYFTPPAGDPLTVAAADWLGRDAFTGRATRRADAALDAVVAEPGRYGFHATLRAPFRLREGYRLADIDRALRDLADRRPPVLLPPLALSRLGRFFALVPATPSAPLAALEAAVLAAFEPFRAAPTPAEIARRRPEGLTERQRRHLERWGYPHVLDDFRFHMTLTGPVDEAAAGPVSVMLERRFAPFLGAPLVVASLALFVEPAPGAPFEVRLLAPLAGPPADEKAPGG